ncbi:hypothetical protein QTG56_25690 (plasmid) [Rossellomorea sp. AcN35-11]|nr:hypothetical protein [Rossellomorea aquimaris]WJV32009.1 hypothetical protein QTG56_25690 [Rossellomorea sp. AcN35-11]
MKSLRKRALAKVVGKRYKSNKSGGFDIYDKYGSVGIAHKVSDERLVGLIKS